MAHAHEDKAQREADLPIRCGRASETWRQGTGSERTPVVINGAWTNGSVDWGPSSRLDTEGPKSAPAAKAAASPATRVQTVDSCQPNNAISCFVRQWLANGMTP